MFNNFNCHSTYYAFPVHSLTTFYSKQFSFQLGHCARSLCLVQVSLDHRYLYIYVVILYIFMYGLGLYTPLKLLTKYIKLSFFALNFWLMFEQWSLHHICCVDVLQIVKMLSEVTGLVCAAHAQCWLFLVFRGSSVHLPSLIRLKTQNYTCSKESSMYASYTKLSFLM